MDPFAALGASLQPLEGGWSGETFLAEVAGERSVLRIFAAPHHGPHAAEVQESLLRLVRGLVPVPAVREVRRADAVTAMPAMLVTEHLPGVCADIALASRSLEERESLGRALGTVAATLAGMPLLHPGTFADGDLRVEPAEADLSDLPGLVARQADALAGGGWTDAEVAALLAVADDAAARLETVERTCLVHGDLDPQNVLVDPVSRAVTGVVDWEVAHAGHPYADLGALLRRHRDPAYVAGVLAAWGGRHGTDPEAALDLARSADLAALVALTVRPGPHPATAVPARVLRAIAATGDVHAVPA